MKNLMIALLIFVTSMTLSSSGVFALEDSQATIIRSPLPGFSAIVQLDATHFVGIYDTKNGARKFSPPPPFPRKDYLALITISGSGASLTAKQKAFTLEYSGHPKVLLPSDFEAGCKLSTNDDGNSFTLLVAESGFFDDKYGRVFRIVVDAESQKATITGVILYEDKFKKKDPQFEGMLCRHQCDKIQIALGKRGKFGVGSKSTKLNKQLEPSAIVFFETTDAEFLYKKKKPNTLVTVRTAPLEVINFANEIRPSCVENSFKNMLSAINAPASSKKEKKDAKKALKKAHWRAIAALHDNEAGLWAISTFDPEKVQFGFCSNVYKICDGKDCAWNLTKVKTAKTTHKFDAVRAEGLTGGQPNATFTYVTEEEKKGGNIGQLK